MTSDGAVAQHCHEAERVVTLPRAMPLIPPPLGGALTALLIGLLFGLDRERAQRGHAVVFAGIRTFPLVSLCGYLAGDGGFHGLPLPLPAVLLGIVALGVASFALHPAEGATTEVVVVLTALLGGLVAWGQAPLAAALAVIAVVLLALRDPLHRLAKGLSEDEVLAVLKFAVVAVVLVPLLPRTAVGPYDAIVPHSIGVLVVLLTAVSLAGYVLVRARAARGLALAGGHGGLVSSTAVTLSFSARARCRRWPGPRRRCRARLDRPLCAGGPRPFGSRSVAGPVAAASPRRLLRDGRALRLAALARARERKTGQAEVSLGNPVELGHASVLAGLFARVTVAARAAQAHLGTAGLWAWASWAASWTWIPWPWPRPSLRRSGSVDVPTAASTYLFATVSNLLFKSGAVLVAGGGRWHAGCYPHS